jgi:hypothetical protein
MSTTDTMQVDYQVAPACPDVATFTRAVEDRAKGRTLNVDVRVRIDSAWVGKVTVGEAGERTVTGATCDEVVSALALATAMTLEPIPDASADVATPPPASMSPMLAKQRALAASLPTFLDRLTNPNCISSGQPTLV